MSNESSNTSQRNEPPSQQQKHSLVEGSIKASLIRMTLPMIVGMFMMFTFSLVDTFFVSLLGTAELTAISFTFPITFTIMSLAIGLGIGASAVVAKYIGREDLVRAKESSTVINYVALAFAAVLIAGCWFFMEPLFTVMGADATLIALIHDYMSIWFPGSVLLVGLMTANSILRAHGDSKTPSIIMAGSGLINACLDPLLIFGWGPVPAMGLKGAAIATLTAWTVGYGYLFYHLAIKHRLISTSLPSQQILISSSREMLRIGLPAAGANMMTPLAMGTMTAIAAGSEPASSQPLASVQGSSHSHSSSASDVIHAAAVDKPKLRGGTIRSDKGGLQHEPSLHCDLAICCLSSANSCSTLDSRLVHLGP